MLIENQVIKANIKNCKEHVKKYYSDKGYDISLGAIYVKAEDLWPESHARVKALCDFCKTTIVELDYRDYYRSITKCASKKFTCMKCKSDKRRESTLMTYGSEEFLAIPEVQKRKRDTCIEKYGGPSPMYSAEVRSKQKQVLQDKYGVTNPSRVEEFQIKKAQTKYENGTCNFSKEQKRICDLLNGCLNYPIGKYNADILIENSIILEYDGDGHDILVRYRFLTDEEFAQKETERNNYFINNGYKIIRFINKKWWQHISDEEYINAMDKCKSLLHMNNIVAYDFNRKEIIL